MKIIFLSNYFNHHQKFLSDAFDEICENYQFVATSKMRDERKQLGYGNIKEPEYVVDCSEEKMNIITEGAFSSFDAVLLGSAPESYINARQKEKKLVFRYSERLYKKKYQWYKWPFRLLTFYKRYGKNENTYLLCASAFAYADYAKHFAFVNKAYKWGYFPETKKYSDIDALIDSKKNNSLLWVGRLIDLKHPDYAIQVAKRLKDAGYYFKMNIIGTGEMEKQLKEMITYYDLSTHVHMLGPMAPERVREYMEQSQIYLFTSDRNEGWGAVLNESMNSACAVVASHAIGAVPYLLKDGENGSIYYDGDVDELYEKVKQLLDNPLQRRSYSEKAYKTITETWNAEVAAQRLINLVEHISAGEKHPDLYKTGPCSKAEIIKDGWYQSK